MSIHHLPVPALLFLLVLAPGLAHAEVQVEASWQKMSDAAAMPNGPGKRSWTDLSYDPVSKKIILIGGSGSGTYLNDIWHYDVSTDAWTNIVPHSTCPGHSGFSGPDGRDTQSVEYDPVNDTYLLLGGGGYKCGPLASRIADLGTTSAQITDPTLQATEADYYKHWSVTVGSKRVYVQSYDPNNKTLTLASPISGLAPGSSYKLQVWTDGHTWEWSPTTGHWRSLEHPHWNDGTAITTSPYVPKRPNPAVAYSSRDKTIVAFGSGPNGGGNDVWALDLTSKAWVLKQPHSSAKPILARAEATAAMVYDSQNDVFVLFGGRCSRDTRCPYNGSPLGDTWIYDLKSNSWTEVTPPISPTARMQHHMVYDAENGLVVMFGGIKADSQISSLVTEENVLDDLWIYDTNKNTWTEITQDIRPEKRYIGAITYDPENKTIVLYGGNNPGKKNSAHVWQLKLTRFDNQENQTPVADFTVNPIRGDTETIFSFNAQASHDPDGHIVSYAWDLGDGSSAAGSMPTHRYNSAGSYIVTLSVTDNRGGTSSKQVQIEVGTPNPPVIDVTNVRITGTTTGGVNSINVNGTNIPVVNGAFQFDIPMDVTSTVINLEATNSGGTTSSVMSLSAP